MWLLIKVEGTLCSVQMDNNWKHAKEKSAQEAKKVNILQWPRQWPDLSPIQRLYSDWTTNKQEVKVGAVKACQSI